MTLKVALPDTSLIDCPDIRLKTIKVGQIARALAVFRVDEIFIYNTGKLSPRQKRDADLLVKLLRFMDTPQYLRRRIFPTSASLKFAGLLPPLRTKSHPLQSSISNLSVGTIRWGVQARVGKIDLGLDQLVDYPQTLSERDPTLFMIESVIPQLSLKVINRSDVSQYWGFESTRTGSLPELLKQSNKTTRIGFSRKAPMFKRIDDELQATVSNTKSVLAVFGGPNRGILELFDDQKDDIKQSIDFWTNTIDNQGTETVRLEEALMISLGLLNNSVGNLISQTGFYD
ncbi:MAG: hypothetical protein JW779_09205 [Candidatus Thorarchaeota archaeon]|nr:hypothetical protein [Candidatus Thorarchaeota archaeon]